MNKKFDIIYQFRITLKYIKPPVWRNIIVPENYSFWDLHVAIQDAMGWEDYHLHEFVIPHPDSGKKVNIGIPTKDDGFFEQEIIPEETQKIYKWFNTKNRQALYRYDFGDNWEHEIILEDILKRDPDIDYPICISGKRACPPEDCGGIGGYVDFLSIISDPKHEEYQDMLTWAGGDFDPEYFKLGQVSFSNPDKR